MNRFSVAAGVAALVFASSSASAADLTGSRIEARLGWNSVSAMDESESGVVYGVAIGHDFAVSPKVVIGGEVAFDLNNAKECVSAFGEEACLKAKRDLSVAARIGYLVAEDALLYAKAGYANGRIRATYDDGVDKIGVSEDGDGVVLGAGLEHNFSGKLYAKVEYSYTNYEADFSRHQIITGLGIRF